MGKGSGPKPPPPPPDYSVQIQAETQRENQRRRNQANQYNQAIRFFNQQLGGYGRELDKYTTDIDSQDSEDGHCQYYPEDDEPRRLVPSGGNGLERLMPTIPAACSWGVSTCRYRHLLSGNEIVLPYGFGHAHHLRIVSIICNDHFLTKHSMSSSSAPHGSLSP